MTILRQGNICFSPAQLSILEIKHTFQNIAEGIISSQYEVAKNLKIRICPNLEILVCIFRLFFIFLNNLGVEI